MGSRVNGNWANLFKYLENFQKLKYFKVVFDELDDSYLENITKFINKEVKDISFEFNSYTPSRKEIKDFNRLKNLKSFDLRHNTEYIDDDEDIDKILKDLSELQNLESLSVYKCLLTNFGLNCVLNLTEFDITFSEIEDQELIDFINKALKLKNLSLDCCHLITENLMKQASEVKVRRKDSQILNIRIIACNNFNKKNVPKSIELIKLIAIC